MTKNKVNVKEFAGIEYHGAGGTTRNCLEAIVRLIQFGSIIQKAYLLSNIDSESECGQHCYLIITELEDYIAVKSGFSSGYGGEGPAGLSLSLQLLIRHGIEIEEYEIDGNLVDRIDQSCLLTSDLDFLTSQGPIRPVRIYDYIQLRESFRSFDDLQVRSLFPDIVPFSIIDIRLMDIAINLANQPDQSLMSGFKRLEDIIRKRTNLNDSNGAKLFSQAFLGSDPALHWPDISEAELKGRVSLFTGTYMAYRNKRAHREYKTDFHDAIQEFLLINQLFVMEQEAKNIDVSVVLG